MKNIAQNNSNYKVGRIIIVDDEAELMSALCEMLSGQGYETAGFLTGAEALAALKEREFDLLLTDLMMPGMDGIELIRAGIEIDPNLIGIIMTGHGTVQTAVEAMKTGAFDYILKPFKLNTVLPLLSRAMQVRNLRLENLQLKETVAIHELGKAISYSSDLNSILNKIADAALQQCSADEVSIMLPTKSGRELYVAVVRGGRTENLGEHVPIEQGIAGWVASNRESIVLRGEVDDPRMTPIQPRSDIHIAVSMPMLSQSKLVGVLNVNITKSHRQFTLGQLKALSILVSIIAPILENTALYIQIRKAEEEYRSIFENAHEGIFRSVPGERFIAANPALARIFGYDSPEDILASITGIARQIYANPDDAAELARIMDTQGEIINHECQAYCKNGSRIWISVSAHPIRDEKGVLLYQEGTIEDITGRKLSELRLKLAKEILETLNRQNDVQKLINDILHLLKEHTGIEAMGIRLKEGEDYPYFVSNGFPDYFLEDENHLCASDDAGDILRDSQGNAVLECMCGNILRGRTDPSLPFFTKGGSFWTNSTTKLLASTSEEERQGRTRNRCNAEGYESVALVPLKAGEKIIGLLQLNDSRKNLFTLDRILFFEGIGAGIGIAVARRRSVEALRESEESFRGYLENAPDGVYLSDLEGNFLYGNNKCEEILGCRREELIGKNFLELNLLSENSLNKAVQLLQANIEGKSTGPDEIELISKEGRLIPVEITTSVVQRMGRTIVIAFVRDITERKQAEEWLLKERSMVDRIMKTSPAGIIVRNIDGRIVFANKRAEEIYGLAMDELTRRAYDSPEWQITDFDGSSFPIENLPFSMVISSGNPVYGIRHAIGSPDGRRVYLSINGAPFFDDKGNMSDVVLTIDDITDRKRAEEALESERTLLRNLIDNVPDRIYAKDAEGRFIICNEAMIRRMGKTSMDELVGKSDFDLLPPEMAQRFHDDEQAIIQSGIPMINREEPLTTEGGTITRWNLATKVPLLDKEGNRIGLVGVGREITDLKQAEQKLKDTLESLRKAVGTTIQVMVSAVEKRDPYTAGHQLRSANLASAIATEMGLPRDRIDGIQIAGSIHDIGKLSIPAEILSKPTKLSKIEFSLIKEHAQQGFEILKGVESSWPLAEIVHQHHERMDGSGYPRNLKGDEILMEARIMAVADVVESMASHRPYRPALGIDTALEEISKNRGILYDPEVTDACLKLFREKGFKLENT